MMVYKYLLKRIIQTSLYVKEYTEDLEVKCKPDYIQSLPGNLKTSDSSELQHRLDVIDERIDEYQELSDSEAWIQADRQATIDELTEDNEEWQKKIDDIELMESQLETYMKDMQSDAFEAIDNIKERFEKYLPELNKGIINGKANIIYSELMGLNELFSYGGIIISNDADSIRYLAQRIDDYASSHDDVPAGAFDLVVDLNKLADRHDATKNKNFGDFVDELGTWRDDKKEWQDNIDKNNKEINRSIDVIKDSEKQQAEFYKAIDNLKRERKRTDNARKEKEKREQE